MQWKVKEVFFTNVFSSHFTTTNLPLHRLEERQPLSLRSTFVRRLFLRTQKTTVDCLVAQVLPPLISVKVHRNLHVWRTCRALALVPPLYKHRIFFARSSS